MASYLVSLSYSLSLFLFVALYSFFQGRRKGLGWYREGKGREREDNGERLGHWQSMAKIGMVALVKGGTMDGDGGTGQWWLAVCNGGR